MTITLTTKQYEKLLNLEEGEIMELIKPSEVKEIKELKE